jgi:hypothetical protein
MSFSYSKTGIHRFVLLLLVACVLAGCGEPGAPQPPSLNLPEPVRDLTATRTGNTVHLAWKTSDRTTDHTPVSGNIRTHICRTEGSGPCELVTDLPLPLGKPSQFDDTLPTDVLQGQPQLLTYYVELFNHGRKSAGRSNAGYSASGPAAPDLSSLGANIRLEGVELHWPHNDWSATPGSVHTIRIIRLDQTPPAPKSTTPTKISFQTHEEPLQTLEVEDSPKGRAIDRTAQFGQNYRYQALCVEKMTLDGHAIEIVGLPSQPISIFTKDTFPPAVPTQLAAAADASSHAIDLSWSPNDEPDLAGYIVYRRDSAGNRPAERISGPAPLVAPAFHDTQAQPGKTYAYSVSAVDQNGNESARSAEAQETLNIQ